MLKQFDSSYAGHIDLENVGYGGTPINDRLYPNEKLASALSKAEAQRVAIMAQDGFARAIRPAHTPFDGDTIFVLATGRHALPEPRAQALARIGAIAADCVSRAVARGVFAATTLGERPGWRDVY